ncbi:hypothetical protein NM208_g17190 [Fusarium decemcellulare]|uniref:Uncharacterized protein n=1 Tax=Fusarium decemcellulare TaxID=57161 RepID=A0ACC1RBH3_9HYPO|nr:hypothetical protein NM208_g17190 [Fusarium decemcellulare]
MHRTESRLPFATGGGGRSGFPRPNFQRGQQYNEDIQAGDLYQLELVNSQAELDKMQSELSGDPHWLLMLWNWRCHRELKTMRCEGKGLEGPTTMSRDEDEFDFEFRDGPSTQVQSVSGEEGFDAADDRIERAQDAIKMIKELGVEPVPEMPNFPRYHLIYFQTISIRLITGPPPPLESGQDPISAALPPHNYPFQRVKGSPLFSPEGELVGSLHLDDVSSHKAGIEVECLIMSSSFQPIEGSALPSPKEAVKEEDDWNLFWILYVVEIEGIYERRGVGQVLDSALVKAALLLLTIAAWAFTNTAEASGAPRPLLTIRLLTKAQRIAVAAARSLLPCLRLLKTATSFCQEITPTSPNL